jgi:adenosylcobinamide kinase / adenosylcobinamide-phosphate guanylyltransferase
LKTLFIGGIKSGKSKSAESFILKHNDIKPYYLATTELLDSEMSLRVVQHKEQRKNRFTTIEEPLQLYNTLQNLDRPILIECLTMWINNMLYHKKTAKEIYQEIELILQLPQDICFVLNDVGAGVIPNNRLARTFVDISGTVAQQIADQCDEVYFCIAGLQKRMK